ncbi:hypothetical protein HZS_4595 [Henneguya salminicola]|nr:hypothetical protein HZS_4595 [Henneguya salminicola]
MTIKPQKDNNLENSSSRGPLARSSNSDTNLSFPQDLENSESGRDTSETTNNYLHQNERIWCSPDTDSYPEIRPHNDVETVGIPSTDIFFPIYNTPEQSYDVNENLGSGMHRAQHSSPERKRIFNAMKNFYRNQR